MMDFRGEGGDLPGRIARTIESEALVGRGRLVLVACSGGVDSMVLLEALCRIAPGSGFDVAACHLDHGLRGSQGEREQGLVSAFCAGRGIPFRGGTADVAGVAAARGLSRQEAAREIRYAFFRECLRASGADRIATAHHADDQAETVLLRLLRGSGPRGLRGIPIRRDGIFIRPMLGLRKREIRAYAHRLRIPYREDPGNLHLGYRRNRIRHEILPALEAAWPGARASLLRLARWLGEEGEIVEPLIDRAYEEALLRRDAAEVVLERRMLAGLPPYLLKQVIRRGVLDLGARYGPASRHLETALEFVRSARSGRRIDLPGGMRMGRDGGEVFLRADGGKRAAPPDPVRRIELKDGWNGIFRIGERSVRIRVDLVAPGSLGRGTGGGNCELFDPVEIAPPVRIRAWRAGDRIVPFGMRGRKKVADLLRERGVAGRRRADIPVIEDERSILWVVGVRRSARGRVTAESGRALSIRAESRRGPGD